MNASPMCCGTTSIYVDNIPGKEYYFCRECKNEVSATVSVSMEKPVGFNQEVSLGHNCMSQYVSALVTLSKLNVEDEVWTETPWPPTMTFSKEYVNSLEEKEPTLNDVHVGQLFEPYYFNGDSSPCLQVIQVDHAKGTVTMQLIPESGCQEEQDESFDY